MAENSVWKAKWGRAADLALPFPSRRPGRFNRRREKTKIEALDVRDARRAAKSNGRLPCRGSTLKSRHGLALAIVKLYWTQMAPDSPPERLQVIERCSTSEDANPRRLLCNSWLLLGIQGSISAGS